MPIARMRAVVLDCPDPRALAEFYRVLVGGEVTHADDWVNTFPFHASGVAPG